MQTDLWLTETGNQDQCPLCSTPLPRGARTCFACGFSGEDVPASSVWIDPAMPAYQNVMPFHTGAIPGPVQTARPTGQLARRSNPETPPPPRVSVKQPATSSLRPEAGSALAPHHAVDAREQQTPPLWQYETPSYIAAGSLPMLSLLSDGTPTYPMKSRTTRRLSSIEEIDTVPPGQQGLHEQPTADIAPLSSSRALVPASPVDLDLPSTSWTAGKGADSRYAQLIASPARLRRAFSFNPLDTMRWWLLRPGRIEFILWLGGTVLLVAVTCAFLLVSAFSFQWLIPASPTIPGIASSGNSSNYGNTSGAALPLLVLEEKGPVTPGQLIHLHGSSFSHDSQVTFTLDGKAPLLDVHGRPALVRTDAQGSFSCVLWLSVGQGWTAGPHYIFARDARKITTLLVVLATGSGGVTISSSPPVTASTPGASHTPASTPVSGGTPVNQTPVPQTPTPPASPSPAQTPTMTPTPGTTSTITPTTGATATVAPGTPAPSPSAAANTGSLSNALNSNGDASFGARLASVNPLVWIMVACYLCSMMLLGLAGVVHKRHR